MMLLDDWYRAARINWLALSGASSPNNGGRVLNSADVIIRGAASKTRGCLQNRQMMGLQL